MQSGSRNDVCVSLKCYLMMEYRIKWVSTKYRIEQNLALFVVGI